MMLTWVLLITLAGSAEPHGFDLDMGLVSEPSSSAVYSDNPARLLEAAKGVEAKSLRWLFGGYYLLGGTLHRQLTSGELSFEAIGSEPLMVLRKPGTHSLFIADATILARRQPGVVEARFRAALSHCGVDESELLRRKGELYRLRASSARMTIEVVRCLRRASVFTYVEPDLIYKKSRAMEVDDPRAAEQWHLNLVGARAAWDISSGTDSVVIAIIDSGVDLEHPEFHGRLVSPRDSLDFDEDPTPDDHDGHGTGCAGLAAAASNNGLGVAGLCPGCSIMPIRIMSEEGWGRFGADVDAFYWAAEHGAHILSNSWGTAEPASIPVSLEDAIVEAATSPREGAGSLILFASGNEYRENHDYELASHPLVLGVGATDDRDLKEYYSNWGEELDLTAPAGSVTTDMLGDLGYTSGDYYSHFGGTSAATPVVAGVAGLILSTDTSLTRVQMTEILLATTDQVGEQPYEDGFNTYYGHGRVNALRALQAASGGDVCQPQPEVCDNTVDDDCDGLVDDADPSCAPPVTELGAPCTQDYQCGQEGTCLASDWGFVNGYCSVGCEGECPFDGVCDQFWGRQSVCFATCTSMTDCRAGYDCLEILEEQWACMPSCTVGDCPEGEYCDERDGRCVHDGPVISGGPCTDSLECADDGLCFSEEEYGILGGVCGRRCGNSRPCEDDFACVELGWLNICLPSCLYNSDCRDGYVCHPREEGDGGVCWESCATAGCEDGDFCNQYGLCGEAMPPLSGDRPPEEPEPEPEPCDGSCECDPAACAPEPKSGCNGAPAGSVWLIWGLLGLTRWRRRRSFTGLGHFEACKSTQNR